MLSHFNHTEKAEGVAIGSKAQITGSVYGQLEFLVGLPTVFSQSYTCMGDMERERVDHIRRKVGKEECEGKRHVYAA